LVFGLWALAFDLVFGHQPLVFPVILQESQTHAKTKDRRPKTKARFHLFGLNIADLLIVGSAESIYYE
jgi:hypothetical protein